MNNSSKICDNTEKLQLILDMANAVTVKGSDIITPSTSEQIAVNAGTYVTGNIIVEPIPSEYVIPSNTIQIRTNDTHNVAGYAFAQVDVPPGATEIWTLTMEDGSTLTKEVVIV